MPGSRRGVGAGRSNARCESSQILHRTRCSKRGTYATREMWLYGLVQEAWSQALPAVDQQGRDGRQEGQPGSHHKHRFNIGVLLVLSEMVFTVCCRLRMAKKKPVCHHLIIRSQFYDPLIVQTKKLGPPSPFFE